MRARNLAPKAVATIPPTDLGRGSGSGEALGVPGPRKRRPTTNVPEASRSPGNGVHRGTVGLVDDP